MRAGLLVAVVVALVSPSAAAARGAFVVGAGQAPGVAVDAAGVTHIAFNAAYPSPAGPGQPLMYCALRPGVNTCAARPILIDKAIPEAQPALVHTGPAAGQVDVISNRLERDGIDSPDVLVRSVNAGATFGRSLDLGSETYFAGAFGPDATVTLADANRINGVTVQRFALTGPVVITQALLWPGQARGSNQEVGYSGRTPVVISGGARDKIAWSAWSGRGDSSNAATWSAPKRIVSANYYSLASGPRGLYLLNERFPRDDRLQVRHFNGKGFPTTGTIRPVARRSGVIDDALVQDSRGRFVAVWYADVTDQIRASASRDGRHWAHPVTLATGVPLVNGLTAAIGPNGKGMAVFGQNAGNVVRATRFDLKRLLRR